MYYFFYRNGVLDALLAIIQNYSTVNDICMELDFISSPLVQIMADLDIYIDKEYSVNALPAEIDGIANYLISTELNLLLTRVQYLFESRLGHTEFRVERAGYLPNSTEIAVDIQIPGLQRN